MPGVEQSEEIAVFTAQLGSRNARDRAQASRALQRRGPAALPALEALLAAARQKRARRRPLRAALTAALVGLFALFELSLTSPLAWGLIFVLGLLGFALASLCAATTAEIEAIRILGCMDDVRAVGPLLESLEWREMAASSGARSVAARALCRLLPRLRPEDGGLLNQRQRACLYRLLRRHPSDDYTELIVVLLGAVAQVGDAAALAPLERMARDSAALPPRQRVRTTAEQALAHLKSSPGFASGSLLRPAAGLPASHLLLPAGSSPPADPQQLLRSGPE